MFTHHEFAKPIPVVLILFHAIVSKLELTNVFRLRLKKVMSSVVPDFGFNLELNDKAVLQIPL